MTSAVSDPRRSLRDGAALAVGEKTAWVVVMAGLPRWEFIKVNIGLFYLRGFDPDQFGGPPLPGE
jgi:hypothetical protein